MSQLSKGLSKLGAGIKDIGVHPLKQLANVATLGNKNALMSALSKAGLTAKNKQVSAPVVPTAPAKSTYTTMPVDKPTDSNSPVAPTDRPGSIWDLHDEFQKLSSKYQPQYRTGLYDPSGNYVKNQFNSAIQANPADFKRYQELQNALNSAGDMGTWGPRPGQSEINPPVGPKSGPMQSIQPVIPSNGPASPSQDATTKGPDYAIVQPVLPSYVTPGGGRSQSQPQFNTGANPNQQLPQTNPLRQMASMITPQSFQSAISGAMQPSFKSVGSQISQGMPSGTPSGKGGTSRKPSMPGRFQ